MIACCLPDGTALFDVGMWLRSYFPVDRRSDLDQTVGPLANATQPHVHPKKTLVSCVKTKNGSEEEKMGERGGGGRGGEVGGGQAGDFPGSKGRQWAENVATSIRKTESKITYCLLYSSTAVLQVIGLHIT